jgi:hypothetical protein
VQEQAEYMAMVALKEGNNYGILFSTISTNGLENWK